MTSVNRRTFLAGLLATSTVGIAGCGGAGGSGSDGALRIGAWLPLTGAVAASGVPQRAGADAYFAMRNQRGGINGRQIEWIVRDNAFDSQQTLQVARRLIGQDGVVAIVNANGTPTTEATFPFVLQQSRVPILNPYAGDVDWYTPPRWGLFGSVVLFEDQTAAAATWAVQDGARSLLVVHSDPEAFVNAASAVEPAARAANPAVTTQLLPVKFQTTDYSPIVSQVRSAAPDAVLLVLSAPEAAAYLKEAQLQRVAIPGYSYAPVAADAMLSIAGPAAEGFKAVQLVRSPDDPHPSVQEFRDAMARHQPGQSADFIALWGWMNAKLFAEIAATIQGPITSEKIVAAYERTKGLDIGVAPVMSFSPTKHLGTREVQRVVVQNRRWTPVGEFFAPPAR